MNRYTDRIANIAQERPVSGLTLPQKRTHGRHTVRLGGVPFELLANIINRPYCIQSFS